LLIVINLCVFLTILNFTIHASIKVAADDICREITRENGMFALWQRAALQGTLLLFAFIFLSYSLIFSPFYFKILQSKFVLYLLISHVFALLPSSCFLALAALFRLFSPYFSFLFLIFLILTSIFMFPS